MKIPFTISYCFRKELEYIKKPLEFYQISGGGTFPFNYNFLAKKELGDKKFLSTTSCTCELVITR